MNQEELAAALERAAPRAVYLLAGPEVLLRDDALALLREKVLAGGSPDFNLDRLDGASASASDLLDAVRALPMFAERRLVILRDPEAGRAGRGRAAPGPGPASPARSASRFGAQRGEAERRAGGTGPLPDRDPQGSARSEAKPSGERVGRAAPGPGPAGFLDALADCITELRAQAKATCVLAIAASQLDRRARWVKAVGEDGIVACKAPERRPELLAFLRREAARQSVALDAAAAELLADRIGPELLLLRQEIAKASLLAGPGQRIAREHIAVGSADVAEEPVWDLTDAIAGGDASAALELIAKLLRTGAVPQQLLGALASHFRRLLRIRSGGEFGGPAFLQRKLEGQARRYSPARLQAAMRAIHQTDRALKGEGALAPDLALERLVIGLL